MLWRFAGAPPLNVLPRLESVYYISVLLQPERLRADAQIVCILARVRDLPYPSANRTTSGARKGRRDQPACRDHSRPVVHGRDVPESPCVDGGVAGHEVVTTVRRGSLQENPVSALPDHVGAGDLHPSLTAVVRRKLGPHLQLRPGGQPGHRDPRAQVPLLPCLQPLRVERVCTLTRVPDAAALPLHLWALSWGKTRIRWLPTTTFWHALLPVAGAPEPVR